MNTDILLRLQNNSIKNIALIGFAQNYKINEYFINGNSIIAFGKSDNYWAHISSSSRKELLELLQEHHSKSKYYFSIEDWMIPLVLKFGEADWRMTTNRYILKKPTIQEISSENIKTIELNFSDYIYQNSDYKEYTSTEYIEDRLIKDISSCIIIDDKLAAWGFTHDDGALGFINVLPEFRRKGLASLLMKDLINKKIEANKPIFCNVVPDNEASINMVLKLGFEFDRRCSWIKLN